MPPIQLTRSERASLRKVFKAPCTPSEIPADHAEKFANYDLVTRNALLIRITALGQLELLRQRFRNLKTAAPALPTKPRLQPFRRPALLTNEMRDSA